MNVLINGENTSVEGSPNIGELLLQLGIEDHDGMAVAVQEQVVPKNRWSDTALAEGQSITIIKAVQGG